MLTNLRALSRVLTKEFDKHLLVDGVNSSQLIMLKAIESKTLETLSDLATNLSMDRTTFTRNASLLKKHKYISSETATDKRKRIVALTEKGREIIAQSKNNLKNAEQKIKNILGESLYCTLNNDLWRALTILKHLNNQL
jgi:DNA-binding MarR family transcriptional regulator